MVILLVVGLLVGIGIGLLIGKFLERRSSFGAIVVTKTEGRTLYSLELNDYPEKIEFRKKVVFRVEAPEESDRK